MGLNELTGDTFDDAVLTAQVPLVLDFWAPQCAPCLALMPTVEELAEANEGKVQVHKVNAAQNRRLCIRLRVMSLPTYLYFSGGEERGRLSGTVTVEQLTEFFAQALA